MTTNFLTVTAQMILEVQRRGQTPLGFAMNQATRVYIAGGCWLHHKATMSAAARVWYRLRHGGTAPVLDVLHGLPVMVNPQLQDGMIFLQLAGAQVAGMGVPPGMEQAAKAAAQENARRGAGFWKEEPAAPPAAAQEDAMPTLNDLASGTGDRPSASDVLMKAMERCDDLSGIVVVRVFRNGDVDLCLNVDQFAAQGVLQKAQQYLFMKGM